MKINNRTPWHEGLSREELIGRCEQAIKQSKRNNEAANRAIFQVDDLQKRIHKANERCSAHTYVGKLEQLCMDMFTHLALETEEAKFVERMAELGLLEGELDA